MRIPARHPELRRLLAGITDVTAVRMLADFLEERCDERRWRFVSRRRRRCLR